jgi:aconitase B
MTGSIRGKSRLDEATHNMSLVLGRDLGNKLRQALGLPEKTVWFELRCHCEELATVRCGYYLDDAKMENGKLVETLAEFELRERPKVEK